MLEDLEDKRSVHSFHSFHGLRTSRSHHGPRTNFAGDDADSRFLRTTSPTAAAAASGGGGASSGVAAGFLRPCSGGRGGSARYYHCSTPPSNTYPNLHLKSQSYENVPLVAKQRASALHAATNPVCKVSPPHSRSKTLSQSDIHKHTETAI
ncbi:uncharacterized protein LOC106011180 [Aplysia californica]|uniref:Uncharacterized protein LOC106011180 n=1 Tax=Aplysia californica TaxID=6500 RepID=A0ABM0ZVH1_APLCA|nr:uncharacterized protein LOC106011180 [Aplysia californica]